ncbi:MAG: hypothetical protein IPK99_08165 [Flavobacteriales bacterium]|nr:hypothetical protein [Flavobacteriales bacterium]
MLLTVAALLFVSGSGNRLGPWWLHCHDVMHWDPKVHDGGDSVFYARSRMFLATPLLLAWAIAACFSGRRVPAQAAPWLLGVMLLFASLKWYAGPAAVDRELAAQDKAYVREERVEDLRLLCAEIAEAASASGSAVVAPIRWPGIKVDHKAHFQAHFVCYVCASLIDGAPPAYGPGYDRRSWVHDLFSGAAGGRVLFVGGDPNAWKKAVSSGLAARRSASAGLLLHTVECDTTGVDATIARLAVDDDPSR